MYKTSLLLPPDLYRRAVQVAKARRVSLGHLVRQALGDYLARTQAVHPAPKAIASVLLAEPFNDPQPDVELSTNVDHYLDKAPRRPRRRPRFAAAERESL